MHLRHGLSPEKLKSKIIKLDRKADVCKRELGFYLLELERRMLYKLDGFSSVVQFAYSKLKKNKKAVFELLRISRTLEELTLIDQAFAKGKVCWSAVREITRVAVKETELDWLKIAEEKSIRDIENLVSRATRGEKPPKDGYRVSEVNVNVIVKLPGEDYAVLQKAGERLRDQYGQGLDESQVLKHLAKKFLETSLNANEKDSRKAFQVVYHRCSECDRGWMDTRNGVEGVAKSKMDLLEKEAEVILVDEKKKAAVLEGVGDLGLASAPHGIKESGLAAAPHGAMGPRGVSTSKTSKVPKEFRDEPNSPKIRTQVISRDSHMCAVFGCGNSSNLSAHHVIWRSLGGRTETYNEISVCPSCHQLIHNDLLQVYGSAPNGLVWMDSIGVPLDTHLQDMDIKKLWERLEVKEGCVKREETRCI